VDWRRQLPVLKQVAESAALSFANTDSQATRSVVLMGCIETITGPKNFVEGAEYFALATAAVYAVPVLARVGGRRAR
jgi:hypothetical protein